MRATWVGSEPPTPGSAILVEVMEKWQTGDLAAFEAFFRDYERMVYRNAYLITGSREDAEDVLQDVFTAVWTSRHTFDPRKGKPATWLHRITVNACLRNRRKDRPAMLRVDPEDIDRSGGAGVGETLDDLDELSRALLTLDGRHRTVLVLRYFNDLSYQEMARVMGVPVGTVKSRMNHALGKMRARLGTGQDRHSTAGRG
jgi:RNA polymerase sigma-70 factor (ECF subfamily)